MLNMKLQTPYDNFSALVRKFGRICSVIVLLAGLLISVSSNINPASAQAMASANGMNRTDVVKELKSKHAEKHAEKPVGMGLADNGGLLELFSSEDGETWTLILTMPYGKSFLVGSGRAWAGAPSYFKCRYI